MRKQRLYRKGKKIILGKNHETQRKVSCDEFDEAVFAVRPEKKRQPSLQKLKGSQARV